MMMMIIPWMFVSIGKNLGIDQNCYTVNVSGAQLTTSINGLYYLDRELMCNSREVWIQYSGSHYLYYLSDGFYGWIIGKLNLKRN